METNVGIEKTKFRVIRIRTIRDSFLKNRFLGVGVGFALLIFIGSSATAGTYSIVKEQSVFAVITHKTGYASAFAHDHLVYPGSYDAELTLENDQKIVGGQFSITFSVESLVVDDQSVKTKWFSRIKALGIKNDPFAEVSDKDRRKIRESMLDKSQLDSVAFPTVSAKITAIDRQSGNGNENNSFSHKVSVATTIHGKKIKKVIPTTITLINGTLNVEAFEEFRFSEFGIEPYSAFFGAVKNQDRFHIYVNLTAQLTKDSQ